MRRLLAARAGKAMKKQGELTVPGLVVIVIDDDLAVRTMEHRQIPGTPVFDGAAARKGYALNKMCFSFNNADNRADFLRDEDALTAQNTALRPSNAERSSTATSWR